EKGKLSGDKTRATVKKYLCPLLERGADTIVLGCTHYPFLIPIIREITGPDVSIIDTGAPVSLELRRRLENENILSKNDSPGEEIFWTSGPQTEARKLISRLWNNSVNVQPLPEIYASHDMYLGFMNDQ
ncbi:MAG: aspartate/glutamate racemase family protein, partial [Deltaproteobacteria bacterium]|nr:aspartate/glutamate racemase family protein [Deltaproteobacteria bacterium]